MRLEKAFFFIGLAACSKSGPEGPDTLTLKADNTTIAADGKADATITITASNSDNKPLPAAIVVSLTANTGFLDTAGQTTESITLASDTGTAHFYCTTNANAVVKATVTTPSGDAANHTLTITCGTGASSATGGSTGGTDASTVAITATPNPVSEGGTVTVAATVTDTDGKSPVADGTEVIFSSTFGTFSSGNTATAVTTGGKVTTTLTAPADAGTATITVNFTDSQQTTRTASTSVAVVDPDAYSINVTATTTDLPTIGASTTITATLFCGANPAPGQMDVTLIGPNNIGTLSLKTAGGTVASDGRSISGAITTNGQVLVDFASGVIGGAALVTFTYQGTTDCLGGSATAATFTGAITLSVDRPPQLTSAQFVSVDNPTIRVKGSVAPNTAMLTFKFTDQLGAPVTDGIPVTFTLSPNHSQDVFLTPSATTTAGGTASVYLDAGGQAETVTVTATATQNGIAVAATSTSIAIVGGIPEYSHMSLSCSPNNNILPGLAFDNLQSQCYVDLGDRFGNRVDIGTEVNFRVEAGTIDNQLPFDQDQTSPDDIAVESVTPTIETAAPHPRKFLVYYNNATRANPSGSAGTGVNYAATATAVQELVPPATGGLYFPNGNEVIAANFYPGDATAPDLKATVPLIQTIADVTWLAITQGEESFVDLNGNKTYDPGEPFIDLPEPFLDKNDNGVQDSCTDAAGNRLTNLSTGQPLTDEEYYDCYEDFVDLNGNGKWDAGNGKWDNYTAIWKSGTVRWTDTPIGRMFPVSSSSTSEYTACTSGSGFVQTSTFGADVLTAHLYSGDFTTDTCNSSDPISPVFTGGLIPELTYRVVMSDENYNCPVVAPADFTPGTAVPLTGPFGSPPPASGVTSGLTAGATTTLFNGGDEPCEYTLVVDPAASAVQSAVSGDVTVVVTPPDFLDYEFTWGIGVKP